MTSEELSEWMAYDKLDPVGEYRGDVQAGIIASVLANVARQAFGKKGAKKTKPSDFMPDWDGTLKAMNSKPQSVDEMKQQIKNIVSRFKGKNKDKEQQQKKNRTKKRRK